MDDLYEKYATAVSNDLRAGVAAQQSVSKAKKSSATLRSTQAGAGADLSSARDDEPAPAKTPAAPRNTAKKSKKQAALDDATVGDEAATPSAAGAVARNDETAALRGSAAASSSSSSDAPTKRRGPGRPPQRPPPPPLEKKGIVDAPFDADNRMEFAYEEPQVFKSLFTYFKNIKAKEVHIRFNRDGITFFTRDHGKTSRIVANVDGRHVNWYYCECEFWLGLNRETIEKMFASIDKSFSKITILHRVDDNDSLNFILKDMDVEKECNYHFAVSSLEEDDALVAAEKEIQDAEDTFPVEFTLTDKQFKKSVNDIANYSDTMTVEKLGEQPLQFTYARVGTSYHEVYRNDEKIKLKSKVQPGQSFRCTIKVANARSMAASMVAEDVRVCARETSDMLFRSAIDEKALVVSTLVRLQ